MVSSKLWQTQDSLLTLITTALEANPATAKIRVSLGVPPKMGKEEVFISGEVSDWEQTYPYSGLTAKEETFTIRVGILSMKLGLNYAATRDRVALIGQLIEDAVHADPTLGGLVELSVVRAALLEEAVVGERERAVGLNLDVEVRAHLTA